MLPQQPCLFLGQRPGKPPGQSFPSSALPHRPVVTRMEKQRNREADVEPAHRVLPKAEGCLHKFRPKEYRPHCIVRAISNGKEVLDGFPDLVDETEFLPEFLTDFTDHRLFRRLTRERCHRQGASGPAGARTAATVPVRLLMTA